MDGRNHTKWYILILFVYIPLLIYFELYAFIPLAILAHNIVDPDEDQKWLGGATHRNIVTHSLLWPALIAFCFWLPIQMVPFKLHFTILCIPTIAHLVEDIPSDNPTGKYCISYFWGRLSVNWTRAWLVGNAVTGLMYMMWLWSV
jgi:hypothetical protein